MGPPGERRAIAYSAAAIFAGAAFIGLVETLIPGGQHTPAGPACAALAFAVLVFSVGPRLPPLVLAALGPIGAGLITLALVTADGPGNGAVLYVWPALWMAYFFGTPGTVFILAWVGLVHAIALVSLSAENGFDRWLDVQVGVVIVALVVRTLSARNDRLVARLAAEARIDPLTGLLNRRGFDERVGAEVSRAARDHASLAFVIFDLDHFKLVNDEHGHEMGDRVLAWVAGVLNSHVRGSDIVARTGGEEFVIVIPGATAAGAQAVAERVREDVALIERSHNRGRFGVSDTVHVSISAGIAAGVAPIDAHALLESADQALYAAKATGRNRTIAV